MNKTPGQCQGTININQLINQNLETVAKHGCTPGVFKKGKKNNMDSIQIDEIEQENAEKVITWVWAALLIFCFVVFCFAVVGIVCLVRH